MAAVSVDLDRQIEQSRERVDTIEREIVRLVDERAQAVLRNQTAKVASADEQIGRLRTEQVDHRLALDARLAERQRAETDEQAKAEAVRRYRESDDAHRARAEFYEACAVYLLAKAVAREAELEAAAKSREFAAVTTEHLRKAERLHSSIAGTGGGVPKLWMDLPSAPEALRKLAAEARAGADEHRGRVQFAGEGEAP